MKKSLLTLEDISKRFSSSQVLSEINLSLGYGKVMALCGENGAGKTTLMNIVAGNLNHDGGAMYFKDRRVQFSSPLDSLNAGISYIPQELLFVPELTVAESIFLGRFPARHGRIDRGLIYEKAREYLTLFGLKNIDPASKMKRLSIGEVQIVEIAKALSHRADLFIMDEPTSALSESEVIKLYQVIRLLKSKEKSVIFISHRINEIFEISDVITVLRDGRIVASNTRMTERKLVQHMLGFEITPPMIQPNESRREAVLQVENLSGSFIDRVSFSLYRQEILGIFGLMGSGRSELLQTLFGAVKIESGRIIFQGKEIDQINPRNMIDLGMGLITEDRKLTGLVFDQNVLFNASLAVLNQATSDYIEHAMILDQKEKQEVSKVMKFVRLLPFDLDKKVEEFSGGNQQKVVLGKWLLTQPKILLMDEPTRGVDVGAKSEIWKLIVQYVQEGHSLVMVSSELPEMIRLCHRILVINKGRIVGEQTRGRFNPAELMVAAS